MRSTLVFGGAGQVGRAIAAALAADGWQVDATTQSTLPPGLAARAVQRLDIRASTAEDGADLLAARAACDQLLVISIASV